VDSFRSNNFFGNRGNQRTNKLLPWTRKATCPQGENWDLDQTTFYFRIYFSCNFFVRELVLADRSPPLSYRTVGNCIRPPVTAVLITFQGPERVTRKLSYRSNRCAGSSHSIQDRLGQTVLSLAGPVAH